MYYRSYKYRMYPTRTQAAQLESVFGSVRFLWNRLVANFNSYAHNGPNRPMSDKILKHDPEFFWLKESSISYALQQKQRDFDETKKQFFNKNRKKQLGRMKFKKKGLCKDLFRIPGQALGYSKGVDFSAKRVRITKIGCVKISVDREFIGKAMSYTFSKNKCGQYFVSVLVEEKIELKQK